jgi:hypothetical protein
VNFFHVFKKLKHNAEIYFDYNPPVITNSVINTIECESVITFPVILQDSTALWVEGQFEIQWYFNGNEIPEATDSIFYPDQEGVYSVFVRDINGCPAMSESFMFYFTDNVSIETIGFLIFPNPTLGVFYVEGKEVERVEVYNLDGKKINVSKDCIVDLSDYPRGLYFARIISGKTVVSKRIILK